MNNTDMEELKLLRRFAKAVDREQHFSDCEDRQAGKCTKSCAAFTAWWTNFGQLRVNRKKAAQRAAEVIS